MSAPNAIRQTHTYALLEVPKEVYDDIRGKLEAAGYLRFDDPVEMPMQGIALVPTGYEEDKPAEPEQSDEGTTEPTVAAAD